MDARTNAVELAGSSSLFINTNQPARVKNARGMRVQVEAGAVWITQHGCNDDIYLTTGDSYFLEYQGLTLISSVKGAFALVTLQPSARAKPTLAERFFKLYAPTWGLSGAVK
jgi:hypothetical protein